MVCLGMVSLVDEAGVRKTFYWVSLDLFLVYSLLSFEYDALFLVCLLSASACCGSRLHPPHALDCWYDYV